MKRLGQLGAACLQYGLAVAITLAVMGGFFYAMSVSPAAGTLIPRYASFVDANHTYPSVLSIAKFALAEPLAWLILVFAAAPSIAAVLVSMLGSGRQGFAVLLQRIRPIASPEYQSSGRRAYLILIVANVSVALALLAAGYSFGGDAAIRKIYESIGANFFLAALVVIFGAFLDEGGVLEELGWRGFLMPIMQSILRSPLTAALVIGILWWAWHLPREIPALLDPSMHKNWLRNQAIFLALCIALSVICAYFVNLTGGSVLPAILIHGGTNVWSKALTAPEIYAALGVSPRDVLVVIFALVVLGVAGTNLGKKAE